MMNDPTHPTTLAAIAVIVGGIVRVLKTKKVGDILEALPITRRIPPKLLPWLAVALGVALTMLDAKLNGGITSWKDALVFAVAGVLAGGTAVGGHETVAKLVGSVIHSKPEDPPSKSDSDVEKKKSVPPHVSRTMLSGVVRAISVTALAIGLTFGSGGCATLGASLPHIIAVVVEAGQVLDAIETFVRRYFISNPNPEKEVQVARALARCRSALNVLMRTAEGAENLDDAKVDAAFADFKAAYLEMLTLVRPYGVQPAEGMLKTSEGGDVLEVPEPLALHPRRR